jgi:enoyl-[acyl-carrier protein] reductase I
MRDAAARAAPLGRGIVGADVGSLAAFLASDGASGITGQTLYVDCGVSTSSPGGV